MNTSMFMGMNTNILTPMSIFMKIRRIPTSIPMSIRMTIYISTCMNMNTAMTFTFITIRMTEESTAIMITRIRVTMARYTHIRTKMPAVFQGNRRIFLSS
ncbi:MAG: hypothetical protein R6U50_01710 [Desulfobacterales bacterium]